MEALSLSDLDWGIFFFAAGGEQQKRQEKRGAVFNRHDIAFSNRIFRKNTHFLGSRTCLVLQRTKNNAQGVLFDISWNCITANTDKGSRC